MDSWDHGASSSPLYIARLQRTPVTDAHSPAPDRTGRTGIDTGVVSLEQWCAAATPSGPSAMVDSFCDVDRKP
jgi:hypothetical protein